MPEDERELLHNGLLIGRAISEYRETFGRGDFLVRNVIGVDQESGAIAMADYIRTGQTVQFHVRDAETADEDLRLMLDKQKRIATPRRAGCCSVATDAAPRCSPSRATTSAWPGAQCPRRRLPASLPRGNWGRSGAKNFIHGHTASLALFRPVK